jgi:hypothetical protein
VSTSFYTTRNIIYVEYAFDVEWKFFATFDNSEVAILVMVLVERDETAIIEA